MSYTYRFLIRLIIKRLCTRGEVEKKSSCPNTHTHTQKLSKRREDRLVCTLNDQCGKEPMIAKLSLNPNELSSC